MANMISEAKATPLSDTSWRHDDSFSRSGEWMAKRVARRRPWMGGVLNYFYPGA